MVTESSGKPVAKISPVDESEKTQVSARETLLARLRQQPVVKADRWTREELYKTTVRVALDTNVLAYAEGVNGPSMKTLALELIDGLPPASVVLPVQTLGELFRFWSARLAVRDQARARQSLAGATPFLYLRLRLATLLAAADLAVTHQFGIWDAVIL